MNPATAMVPSQYREQVTGHLIPRESAWKERMGSADREFIRATGAGNHIPILAITEGRTNFPLSDLDGNGPDIT
jgi:hypothetical protein